MIIDVLYRWHGEADGRILAATVMPDHVHVLLELGTKLTIGRTIARWKAEIRKAISYAEDFQRDFWEHQLRTANDIEEYAFYIFLNPYRAGLLTSGAIWPGWWTPTPGLFRFIDGLDATGAPPQEWIEWPDQRFSGLSHGE